MKILWWDDSKGENILCAQRRAPLRHAVWGTTFSL